MLYFRVRRDNSILKVESFAPDTNSTHSGPYYQKRGVSRTIRGGLSPSDHIENARSSVFLLAESAALPKDVAGAWEFISMERHDSVRSSWKDAFLNLHTRADQYSEERERAAANPFCHHFASKLHLPRLRELLAKRGMGGGLWVDQFASGFPAGRRDF